MSSTGRPRPHQRAALLTSIALILLSVGPAAAFRPSTALSLRRGSGVVDKNVSHHWRDPAVSRYCHGGLHASLSVEGVNGWESAGADSKLGTSVGVTTIHCLQDFLDFLALDQRLCIVKFHASWCKSCQKFGIRFKKVAMQESDRVDKIGNVVKEGRVRFAEIELTSNSKICRTLGVNRLPYVHMYRGADGRLCHFACGPNKFQTIIDKMNEYLGMSKEEIDFNRIMDAGDVLGEEIVGRLREQKRLEQAQKREQYDL